MAEMEPGPDGNVAAGGAARNELDGPDPRNVAARVVCDARFSACRCLEELGHPGVHRCPCAGSWDDEGRIYSLPDIGLGVIGPV